MDTSLRGRCLKEKGMGVLGKRVVSRPNSLPLPFRTPATQAKWILRLQQLRTRETFLLTRCLYLRVCVHVPFIA